MISNKIIIECQDCEQEIVVAIKHTDDISEDEIKYCPCCGSDNLNLIVKEK